MHVTPSSVRREKVWASLRQSVLQRGSLCCREELQITCSAADNPSVGLDMVCPLALQGAAVKEVQRAARVPALPSCLLFMCTP